MPICYFLSWQMNADRLPVPHPDVDAAWQALRVWSRDELSLTRCVLHTRSRAGDPYGEDAGGPVLVMQCYFDDVLGLDASLASGGAFERLLAHEAFRRLSQTSGCEVSQQAMLARCHGPRESAEMHSDTAFHDTIRCTYLVAYDKGSASTDAFDAWIADYLTHHVPLLKAFPGLRELEVYTPIHYVSALPYPRAQAAQRNKVVFDDADALTRALHSPVRHALRAHALERPSPGGVSTHYPMTSRSLQTRPAPLKETR